MPAPHVVVAEDDDDMRRIVVEALRRDGLDVGEASDGASLLALIGFYEEIGDPVDLIISDVRMPNHSGLDVLGRLHATAHAIPMILMTAFGDDDIRAEAEKHGAMLFDKPFQVDDLRKAVAKLLFK
jgi:DNA-binding NtrC family response regulator